MRKLIIIGMVLICAASLSYAGTKKIIAIGDSITQGRNFPDPPANPDVDSWRRPFWFLLQNAGYDVDMVGTLDVAFDGQVPPGGSVPLHTDYDLDHEARWGWKLSVYIEAGNIPTWLSTLAGTGDTPDIALVHLGTNDNDDTGPHTGQDMIDDMLVLVGQLRNVNPKMVILIAQPGAYWGDIAVYADMLPQFKTDNSTVQSPIEIVDLYTGWIANPATAGTHTMDWVHPNPSGEQWIADRFFAAVEPYLTDPKEKDSSGGCAQTEADRPQYAVFSIVLLLLVLAAGKKRTKRRFS